MAGIQQDWPTCVESMEPGLRRALISMPHRVVGVRGKLEERGNDKIPEEKSLNTCRQSTDVGLTRTL